MTAALHGRRPTDFFVERTRREGHAVIRVHGEVDLTTAGEFRAAVFEALDYGAPIEIDFGPTSFIDSSGLTVLVGANRRVGFDPTAIIVRHASHTVRRALTVTGLDHFVDLSEEPDRG
jgi:anti-sigma B factor antagonist